MKATKDRKQIRVNTQTAEEIYKWQIHLMKLFYVEERQVVLFNSVGGFESFQTITSDDIPDGMQIFINSAAAQPRDQFTRRNV